MKEEIPLQYQVIEYKIKLRFAKLLIISLFVMFFFTLFLMHFLMEITNDSQYALGESVGIMKATSISLQPQPQPSISIPFQLQGLKGGEIYESTIQTR